ncbi:MAG: 16S rRNA (cytidine(1402)-2'-O)-methyltransferase [Mycoplasmataceae bacterium]|nr:16S rRNA (cytidine(1402)-2'-O)-methyltransferase [Mycoplasmataceae bacterium]
MNNLYVISTPIGNLNDLSLRAISLFKDLEIIYCEDTRTSSPLVKKYNPKIKLISLHKFNEKQQIDSVLLNLKSKDVGLISDAGTPTINDPGQLLIKHLKQQKIKIIPVPGASALTTAISISGLEYNSFNFIGFLPKKEKAIIDLVNNNLNNDLLVAYESPNRIKKTLSTLHHHFGNIQVCLARELTKFYEEIITDNIENLLNNEYKGEIVLIINTRTIAKQNNLLKETISLYKKEGINNKSILNLLSSTTNFKKNDIYEELKND